MANQKSKITANYYFSHIVLRDLFLSNEIYDVIKKVDDSQTAFNEYLKALLYEKILDSKTTISNVEDFKNHKFDMKIFEYKDCKILYVNMPDPTTKGDAYCIALRNKNGDFRYFTLELHQYNKVYSYLINEEEKSEFKTLTKLEEPNEDEFIEYVHSV